MKYLFAVIIALSFACSEEDPAPAAAKLSDGRIVAKHWIHPSKEVGLFLFGRDTITFINIIPNPTIKGIYNYNHIEGTPGTFKNSEYHANGIETQLLSAGRLEIKTFELDYIDFSYDVTYQNGKRLHGSYTGSISNLK